MPLLKPETAAKIAALQPLDDAIKFRLNRLSLPCPDCADDQKCDDHAADVDLIAGYQDRYASAFSDALADMDPEEIKEILQRDNEIPPTVAVLGTVVLKRLRELAADGPALMHLDGRDVVIELDGDAIVEHPLTAGSDDSEAAS
jgi:hypothetical protein